MASFQYHFEHIEHNIAFLESYIFVKANDWALTVMFYTGVHICEALIYNEYKIQNDKGEEPDFSQDCNNHFDRNNTIHKLFYYGIPGGTTFCENYSILDKAAHDARYKTYRVRKREVIDKYSNNFKPITDFFNKYCVANSHPKLSELKKHTFSLDDLKDNSCI
jgi:hypothetical protein